MLNAVIIPSDMPSHSLWKPHGATLPPHRPKPGVLFVLLFALSTIVRADPLLDLVLDDPNNLLQSNPQGFSELPRSFSASTATIASGVGGRALPQITAGPPGEAPAKMDEVRILMAKEPALGTRSFFRAILQGNSSIRSAGVGILPNSTMPLTKIVTHQDRQAKFDGGFDFFFRLNSSNEPPKFTISTKIAQLGVNLGSNLVTRKLFLKIFTADKSLGTKGDKPGGKASLEKSFDAPFENDIVYHGALNFRTSADGSLVVEFCLQQGTGPMVASSSIVASIDNFWLPSDETPSPEKITILIGRNETSTQTLDIASVRIFAPSPVEFPPLQTPGR